MRCLLGLIGSLMAGVAPTGEQEPVVVTPDVALARLESDLTRPPHQLTLPESKFAEGSHWGLFKICVSPDGAVSSTKTIKSTGSAELDAAWSSTVRGWRYQPYAIDGTAVPFCYAMRLQAGQGLAAEKPVIVAPQAARLLTDVRKAPHKPTLPDHLKVDGTTIWGLYKVCVSKEGRVSGVSVVRSAGATVLAKGHQAAVDSRWIEAIKTWTYKPYEMDGKAVPFCYPLRLTVSSRTS